MAGTPKLISAPAYIAVAIANIFTPNAALKYTITHIHVTNKDTTARTFSLYVTTTGAATAGTELVKDYSLAAAGVAAASWDYYGQLSLDGSVAAQILTGVASVASTCVITVEGSTLGL